MPALAAALASLLLAADAPPAAPAWPPFQPPRAVQVTDKTKCDMGTVLSVEPAKNLLRSTTPAGVVTYQVGPEVTVFGKDGKPAGSLAVLAPGQKVRVYYVVDHGARAQEIDLD